MKPEDLHNSNEYLLIAEINYKRILDFIISCLRPVSPVLLAFYTFCLITFLNLVFVAIILLQQKWSGIFEFIGKGMMWASLSFLVVIPLHELLHGIAFLFLGAKRLIFGWNLREMVFYVTSDRFILNKNMLYSVALVPFIFFTLLFGVMCFSSTPFIKGLGALLLVIHTTSCIGDFAIMSYFHTQSKQGDIFTYDDTSTKTSYYFRKIK